MQLLSAYDTAALGGSGQDEGSVVLSASEPSYKPLRGRATRGGRREELLPPLYTWGEEGRGTRRMDKQSVAEVQRAPPAIWASGGSDADC